MAHFYGTLKGARGTATKTGTKVSGISASVQSWDGSLTAELSFGQDGAPVLTLHVRDDSGHGGRAILIEKLRDVIERGLKLAE